jgi:hypothetical protein
MGGIVDIAFANARLMLQLEKYEYDRISDCEVFFAEFGPLSFGEHVKQRLS